MYVLRGSRPSKQDAARAVLLKKDPGRRVDTAVPQVAKISGLLVPYRVPAVVGWFLVAAASQGKQ